MLSRHVLSVFFRRSCLLDKLIYGPCNVFLEFKNKIALIPCCLNHHWSLILAMEPHKSLVIFSSMHNQIDDDDSDVFCTIRYHFTKIFYVFNCTTNYENGAITFSQAIINIKCVFQYSTMDLLQKMHPNWRY